MNKALNLSKNQTVGILSPSWCGPSEFPKVFEAGLTQLYNLGFQTKEYEFTRLQGNAKEKAEDMNKAFADTSTSAIIASIGGSDGVESLPYLNQELIKQNPKPIMGYSDTTAYFFVLARLGVPCYYGPSVMAGFAQLKNYPDWNEYVQSVLLTNKNELKPFAEYNEGYLNWAEHADKIKQKQQNKTKFIFVNSLEAEGKLFGGCIEVIERLKETEYFPRAHFWIDKILFLETSENVPTPDYVKKELQDYGKRGILKNIRGLLFGRPRDYTNQQKQELEQKVKEVLKEFHVNIPLVMNMDFGHTDPQLILPYLAEVRITKNAIEFI